jgi:hypothetical protein
MSHVAPTSKNESTESKTLDTNCCATAATVAASAAAAPASVGQQEDGKKKRTKKKIVKARPQHPISDEPCALVVMVNSDAGMAFVPQRLITPAIHAELTAPHPDTDVRLSDEFYDLYTTYWYPEKLYGVDIGSGGGCRVTAVYHIWNTHGF